MRDKIILSLGVVGTLLMLWNINTIFLHLADEARQGAIWRIFLIHLPAAISGYVFYAIALVSSALFLIKKNFKYDSLAVSCIEVGTMFTFVNLVTGSIWGRVIWGIWWTWDLRLTSQLLCGVLYLGYLLMRPAVAEATQRATMSAILAIFAAADIPLVIMAIRLRNVRTQHPQPVLETGGLDPAWWPPLIISFIALVMIGTALVMIRLRQESASREVDSLRRELHAI